MNGNSGDRHPTPTFKLAKVKNQSFPPGQTSTPFTMRMRDPGWHPDATDDGTGKREELFLEEAIGRDEEGFLIPFGVPFLEPTPGDRDEFNRWILGGAVPDPAPGETPLTSLVRELATACRRYNASLYRLRRLHYHFNDPEDPLPPRNPHGDPELPPVGTPIDQLVADAERDWKTVVIPKIHDLLDKPQSFSGKEIKVVAADMIEVNGYIVSMRVVARGVVEGAQIGGSSLHVSISSAFSSPVP
jgi:hypothetical protein